MSCDIYESVLFGPPVSDAGPAARKLVFVSSDTDTGQIRVRVGDCVAILSGQNARSLAGALVEHADFLASECWPE